MNCSVCGIVDVEEELYAGEVWESSEDAPYETLPILDSWWLGEFDPYCLECAIERDERIWDANVFAWQGLHALTGKVLGLLDERQEGQK